MEEYFELLKSIPRSVYDTRDESDITKLFSIYCGVFDELNNVVQDMRNLRDLWGQSGEILDEIGKIVKEERGNLSDEEYRGNLLIAILRNKSNGSLSTISKILNLVVGSKDYTVRDMQKMENTKFDGTRPLNGNFLFNPGTTRPAAFLFEVPENVNNEYVNNLINCIKSGGIEAVSSEENQ